MSVPPPTESAADSVLEHRYTRFLRNYQGEGGLFEAPIDGARSYYLVATASRGEEYKASLDLVIDPDNGRTLRPNTGDDPRNV